MAFVYLEGGDEFWEKSELSFNFEESHRSNTFYSSGAGGLCEPVDMVYQRGGGSALPIECAAGKQRWTMEEGMIRADGGVSGKNQHDKPVMIFILLIHLLSTETPSENINLF